MVFFKGDKRQFDNIEKELDTSTDTEKLVSIYGVTSYDDIDNCIIPILAYSNGGVGATININNLGPIDLYQFTDNGAEPVIDNWVQEGQIYYLVYTKSNDLMLVYSFNSSNGEGEVPEVESHTVYTPYNILSLTSQSTAAEILSAFYYEEEMAALSEGVKSNKVIIFNTRFDSLPDYPTYQSAIAIDTKQTSDADNVYDKLTVHLPELNAVKVLTFTRTQASNVYTKVVVEDISTDLSAITNAIDTLEAKVDDAISDAATDISNLNKDLSTTNGNVTTLTNRVTQLENNKYTPEDTGWQTVSVIVPTVNGATSNLKARVLNGVLYLKGTLRSHWFASSETNNKVATFNATIANKLGSNYMYFLRPSSNNSYAIGTFYLSDGNIYLETYNTDLEEADVYFELYDVAICI